MMTTQKAVRREFWANFPEFEYEARRRGTRGKRHNAQTADCRMSFCDWVDNLSRNGEISDALAARVTL